MDIIKKSGTAAFCILPGILILEKFGVSIISALPMFWGGMLFMWLVLKGN